MSKFLDGIYARWLERERVPNWPEPVRRFDTSVTCVSPPEVAEFTNLREYEIRCDFVRRVTCRPNDLPHMIESCKKELRHAVHGELLDAMIELDHAIYELNHQKASEQLRELWRILDA